MWNERLSEITYRNVLEFCEQQIPEGTRLDYKRDISDGLIKTITAFANTIGGLILLGVEEDRKNCTPVIPLVGMPPDPGYVARITQQCQADIYPPILPEFSSLIVDPDDRNKTSLVIRIDGSPNAPHATGRKLKSTFALMMYRSHWKGRLT